MLKYLRITVTALSLTACVLLVGLWVRSYQNAWLRIKSVNTIYHDGDYFPGHGIPRRLSDPPPPPPTHIVVYKQWFDFTIAGIPYLPLVLGLVVTGAIPWLRLLPWRFSIRTLLIVTTVVAVGLGMLVALSQAGVFVRGAVGWEDGLACLAGDAFVCNYCSERRRERHYPNCARCEGTTSGAASLQPPHAANLHGNISAVPRRDPSRAYGV
jgi:hypothetical protein